MELCLALLDMLHLIQACILDLRREVLVYSTVLYIGYKHTGSAYTADILLERYGHYPDTASS